MADQDEHDGPDGDWRCAACGNPGHAGASFCPSCGGERTARCRQCDRELPPDASFCPACGVAVGAAGPEPVAPSPSRGELPGGERRRATALFSDLAGYTALNESLDPEEVARVMNRLKRSATRIVEEHGGIVNQFVGDEVMALFGVPKSHDDDPLRAVDAAIALHGFVRELGDELAPRLGRALRLHTAVNTGLMITQLRDSRDGMYGVTGDVINTCARLASLAEDDQILVGPDTHRVVREYFETESAGPAELRGKSEPVTAHRVLRAVAGNRFAAAERRGLAGFAGREIETLMLRRSLDEARNGRARFIAVVGEPGVGKTRLFHEFERSLDGDVRVLHGDCPAYGTVPAYQPFRQVVCEALRLDEAGGRDVEKVIARIRSVAPGLEEHVPLLLALLSLRSDAHPLSKDVLGDSLQQAICDALQELLFALARKHPLVVLLGDWHWADPASAATLLRLADRVGSERVLVLLNYRSGYRLDSAPGQITLELAPLGRKETTRIIEQALGVGVDQALVDLILERSQRNPLFVEEVCQAMLESRVTERGDERELRDLRIPDTVEAVLQARIDQLDPIGIDTLKIASVLGEEFSRALLERMSATPSRIDEALALLTRVGLLHPVLEAPESTFCFKHATVREVAYEMLLLRHRRDLHAAAARALEEIYADRAHEKVEALAYHYARSDEREKAVRYLELSGDKAALSAAMEQALGYYREALRILDEIEDGPQHMARRIGIAVKLARPAIYRPGKDVLGILQATHEQAQRLGDARSVMRSLYWIGWLEHTLGLWSDAVRHFEECVELAEESGDAKLLAQLYSNLGQALCHGVDYPRAVQCLEKAIALRRSLDRGPHPVINYSTAYLAFIDADTGRFSSATERIEEALDRKGAGIPLEIESALISLRCLIEMYRGDWSGCQQSAALLAPRARRIGSTYMQSLSLTGSGCALFFQGDREQGIALMREGVGVLERSGIMMNASTSYSCLAEALALAGRYDEAEKQAELALERARQADRMGEAQAQRALFLVIAGRAPRDDARVDAALARALAVARDKGSTREVAIAQLRAVEALKEVRDVGWQQELLDECAQSFAAMQMPWYSARAEALRRADAPKPGGSTGVPE